MDARVLIAEDDPAISGVVRDALAERLRVTAEVISNGALVMEAALRLRPGVLLLDVELPGLSGLDIFEMLTWERDSPTRIIFVTGRPDLALRALDGAEVIAKPFDLDRLVDRVAELLGVVVPV